MTLITAIIAGLACGYFLRLRPKAVAIFGITWSAVLVVQTFFMLDEADVPPEAWSYVPVQIVILAIGAGLLCLGAKLRARSSRMARAKAQEPRTAGLEAGCMDLVSRQTEPHAGAKHASLETPRHVIPDAIGAVPVAKPQCGSLVSLEAAGPSRKLDDQL